MKSYLVFLTFISTVAFSAVPENYELKYTGMSPINVRVETRCGSLCMDVVFYKNESLYRDMFSRFEVNVKQSNEVIKDALLKGNVIDIYEEEVHRTILPNYTQIQLISRIPTDNEVDMEIDILKEQEDELMTEMKLLEEKLETMQELVDISDEIKRRNNYRTPKQSDRFKPQIGPKQVINKLTKQRKEIINIENEISDLKYFIRVAEDKIKRGK